MVQALRDLILPHSQLANDPCRKQTALDISDSIRSLLQAGHQSNSIMQNMPMKDDSPMAQQRKSSLKPACLSEHTTAGISRQNTQADYTQEIRRASSFPRQDANDEPDENDPDFLNEAGINQGHREEKQYQDSAGQEVLGAKDAQLYHMNSPATQSSTVRTRASLVPSEPLVKRKSTLRRGSASKGSLYKNIKLQRTASSPLQGAAPGGAAAKRLILQHANSMPQFQ